MIDPDRLTAIGRVLKTHGIHGEMNVELYCDDVTPDSVPCVFFSMDGIFVPFFVSSLRRRGVGACLMTVDGVTDERQAGPFGGNEVYAETDKLPAPGEDDDDDYLTLDDLVGYRIVDTDGTVIGDIEEVDDSTENVLFVVERPDMTTVHVPAAEPLIVAVDTDNRTITMDLPSGLW